MLKRVFDIAFAVVRLMVATPAFALLALWIKLDSRGPVFYRGVRVGRWGRTFRIYKFRTMVADAETIGGPSTSRQPCILQTAQTGALRAPAYLKLCRISRS